MIYLDSSALVKLAVTEPESAALTEWLGHSANVIRVSSPIVRVEVPRAVWRSTRVHYRRPARSSAGCGTFASRPRSYPGGRSPARDTTRARRDSPGVGAHYQA